MSRRMVVISVASLNVAILLASAALLMNGGSLGAQERRNAESRLCEQDSRCMGNACVFSPGDRCAPFGTGGCTSC